MKRGERMATWLSAFWIAGTLSQLNLPVQAFLVWIILGVGLLSHFSAITRFAYIARHAGR
jgi:hypothetical protein